ncbi:NAD(P)-dependent oxidoreductase [Streptomyces longispororuber]|uniref:NAD(P)-dependent oxidoreductase n=1 Tax=Streptomyces longispororuber TaxID=68230 RepID=UPI00210C0372|nr:NAD(P)-binding domain-containing protein [Streptomyces longispororuber]MCQ4213591.1 NAD(P)-binding domain-containing protein [Streptomyces longispororuber]
MTNEITATPVTVLGLGAMGHALADALLTAGHPTTVWNRSPGKGEELVGRGARRAATAADAVQAADVVIVCVVDHDAAHAILAPLAADLSGKVVVNLTSDTPERAREAAAWAGRHGIRYLDGAIMVPVTVIGSEQALIFYAGPEDAYTAYEQVFTALGGRATHLGADHGLAAVYDLSILDYFWTTMSGIVHAYALAGADRVPAAKLAPFLIANHAIVPDIATYMAENIDSGKHPGDLANLAMEVAGIDHIVHAAEHRGLDTTVLRAVRGVAGRAMSLGHGADDWSSTVDAVRQPEQSR